MLEKSLLGKGEKFKSNFLMQKEREYRDTTQSEVNAC